MAYDPIAEINKLKEIQKQQALANLDKSKQSALSSVEQSKADTLGQYNTSRNNSLSALDKENATIQPKYYDARNQQSTNSQLAAKNFAEYMAGRGLTSSGTSAQAELLRNVGLQNQIGQLQRQENMAYDDINRRRSDVNTSYDANVAALNAAMARKVNDINSQYQNDLNSQYAGIESNAAQQIIAAQQRLDELARQEAEAQRQRDFQAAEAEKAYQRQLKLAAQKSSASAASKSSKASKTAAQNALYNGFRNAIDNRDVGTAQAIINDKQAIINEFGRSFYDKIYKEFWKWQTPTAASTASDRQWLIDHGVIAG